MADERLQRNIGRLLEQGKAAIRKSDVGLADDIAEVILAIDPNSNEARELKLSLVQSIVTAPSLPTSAESRRTIATGVTRYPQAEPLKVCITIVYLKAITSTNLDEFGDTGWTIKTDVIDPTTGQPLGKEKQQTHDFDRSTDKETGKRTWQFPILNRDSRLADPLVVIGCGDREISVKVTAIREGPPQDRAEKQMTLKYKCDAEEGEANPKDGLAVIRVIGAAGHPEKRVDLNFTFAIISRCIELKVPEAGDGEFF